MKPLSPATLDLFDSGSVAIRSLVKIILPNGTFGCWNGTGTLNYAGLAYKQNTLISIDEISGSIGTAATPFKLVLPASADFGLTPDVLGTIEDFQYKGALITIYDAFFVPNTRALVHVEPMRTGFIDFIDHSDDGQTYILTVHCEDHNLDNHRDGYRTASHSDQQLVSNGDRFFEHASEQSTETFKFGRS